jgi:aspartate beta-hydroxylase
LHVWQEGRVVVFDDTYEHEAWNRSRQTRVVLIFDLWNPYLTEVERAALSDVVVAIGGLREAVESA